MLENFDLIRVLSAAALAFAAMSALIAGTVIGIYGRPSQRTNAIIMAFGTGALIQALAIDLAYHGANRLIHESDYEGLVAWSLVAFGFLLGGLGYYIGNKALDKKGGAFRHPALAKFYFLKKKRDEKARVLEKLSNIDLLRSLPPQDMEAVLETVKPVSVEGGQFIFHKGDEADGLYLIIDGQVQIMDRNENISHTLATLQAGDSFGEMALLTGEPRLASAYTVTPVNLLKIEKAKFNDLIKNSPYLRGALEQLNTQRILQNVQGAPNMDKDHWLRIALSNIERLSKTEEYAFFQKHAPKGAPFAIFLGALMDVIPESIVIGASYSDFNSYRFTFLAAVFLANFPEAMASSNAMVKAGFSRSRIFSLWSMLIVTGAIAAIAGNVFLFAAPPAIITFVEAIAGGAILGMVASVMMPEAYEDGGSEVGLATIAGFLVAFLFTFI
ncbi:MAG: cyclic nucleotide-binding domain-containing protein [Cyclobacteriaceae bacterium]|jgi:CRP-like cAMP-binding protein|nr:cyclic nucleotide-binding domain-containing protein [Cyclobacteriaceae bacterium]